MIAEFLVCDIETSGEAPPAAVIEFGWQGVTHIDTSGTDTSGGRYELHPGVYGSALCGLPEGVTMGPEVRAVHHIDPAELEGLPLFVSADWGGAALNDTTHVVAHNAAFEQQWLTGWDVEWVCTYKCALRAWPEAPKYSNQALKYFLGIADRPEHHPPHRAQPDAIVTAEILVRLLENHSPEQLVTWTKEPKLVTVLPFGKHKGTLLTDAPRDYLQWMSRQADMDADLLHWVGLELERRA